MNYKYICLFMLLIAHIYADVVTVNISTWEELINYKPENKNNEYIFLLDKVLTANSDSGDFLTRFKKITIKGNESIKRIYCTGTDIPTLFHFSSETEELDFTLENIQIKACKFSQVVMEGPNISVSLIGDEFTQNTESAIEATNVKSVTIKDSTFSKNKKGARPQIYVENKKDFKTSVIIENTTGIENTNEIKDATSSGGWGYFSNSNIHFSKVISDGNKGDNNGAVFNIRNCSGEIKDSEFKNSIFNGKGLIYQYYSNIDIYNTSFHDNTGYGCGIYYVQGTSSDTLDKYKPSNLYNCHFENNRGVDTHRAGAAYIEGAQTVNIYDSTFKNLVYNARGGCFQVNNISKITTTNCNFESIVANDAGAIFNSGYDTTVEIKNCSFKDIYANTGAIVNSNSGNRFTIENSYIEDSASYHGLFYMTSYTMESFAIFNNVTFVDNIADLGLLHVNKNTNENAKLNLNVTNSKFLNNGVNEKIITALESTSDISVKKASPVINVNDDGYTNVLIDNCEFKENNVSAGNGVVSVQLNRKGQTVLKNLKFQENTVKNNGGGLYIGSDLKGYESIYDIELDKIVFEGNHAKNGGGLYIDCSVTNSYNTFKKFEINNIEFIKNKADQEGGGLYLKSNSLELNIKNNNIVFKDNESEDNKEYVESYEKQSVTIQTLSNCSSVENGCKIKNEENGEEQTLDDDSYCIYKNNIYRSNINTQGENCVLKNDIINNSGFALVNNYIYYCDSEKCTQMKSVNVLMENKNNSYNIYYCDITGVCHNVQPQNGYYLAISGNNVKKTDINPTLYKIEVDNDKVQVTEIESPNDGYYIDLVFKNKINQLIHCINKSCNLVIPDDIYIPKNKLQGYFLNGNDNKSSNPYIKCSNNGCEEINIDAATCDTKQFGQLIKENDSYSLCFYYNGKVQSLPLTSENNGNYTLSYYENNEFGITIEQVGILEIGNDYVRIVGFETSDTSDTSSSDSSKTSGSDSSIDDNNLNESSSAFKTMSLLCTKTILIVHLILFVLYNIV